MSILRQGDMISSNGLTVISSTCGDFESNQFVVVTHDCDLHQDKNSLVELVECSLAQEEPRKYSNRKSPRILDIEFTGPSGNRQYFRLDSSKRIFVTRKLPELNPNHVEWRIDLDSWTIFRGWLSSWYARPAFPNSSVDRMKWSNSSLSLFSYLSNSAKTYSTEVMDIFFDLGINEYKELPPEIPYEPSISVIYDDTTGNPEGAKAFALGIAQVCQSNYGTGVNTRGIFLEKCSAVSNADFTLREVRRQSRWMLDSISLKNGVEPEIIDA